MASIERNSTDATLVRYLGRLYDEADALSGRTALLAAVAYARGVEGVMLPAPDSADSEHAIALLRFAASLEDESPK